jgi:predicted nucleic acid-binding protein
VILVDVNLLVDATMTAASGHEAAHAWLQSRPSVRLVTDAHLAAIAIEHGLELCSRDRDFARWSDLGLRSRDPLA